MSPLQDGVSTSAAITELPLEEEDDSAARVRRQVKRHREVLLVSCAVWLLAFLLHELPNGRVAVRGLPQFPLPQTCMSRALLGLRCPGCGLTRSIIHLAEGDWRASWHDHRLGGLLGIVDRAPDPLPALRLLKTRATGPGGELAGCPGIYPDWPLVRELALGCSGGAVTVAIISTVKGECPFEATRENMRCPGPMLCRSRIRCEKDCPRHGCPSPVRLSFSGRRAIWPIASLCRRLFQLARGGNLPSECAVIGFARRPWTDNDLRADYEKSLSKEAGADFSEVWSQFANRIIFSPGTFDDPASFQTLKETLARVDRTHGTAGNRVYYLAVSPEFFAPIIANLGEAGLIYPSQQESPWSRVVIEKPFGRDLSSARALNKEVTAVLDESQVYRIDHYLGKETVQNILALRFGNSIFEPVWNRRHVASVQVTVAEEVGMAGGRGAITTRLGPCARHGPEPHDAASLPGGDGAAG